MGIPRAKKKRIFERDNYPCRYCGFDMTLHFAYPHLRVLTVDHVIPRHRGGTHAMNNLVTCCNRCNLDKGDLCPDRFFDIIARRAYDRSLQSSLPPGPTLEILRAEIDLQRLSVLSGRTAGLEEAAVTAA